MDVHEYQGKELLRQAGVPVPDGKVAHTASEAREAATALLGAGAKVVVVKAQIHAGGRGKGRVIGSDTIGGVKVVATADEAAAHAEALLGKALRTHQTGPEGRIVKKVLVEAGSSIASELYAAVLMDRETSRVTFVVSTEGGMDIEEVAEKTPEKLIHQSIDPASGMQPFHGRNLAYGLGLKDKTAKQAAKLFGNLYKLFHRYDAALLEINPLVITDAGDVIALDAKLSFDDNALFRQPDIQALRDRDEEDIKEQRANEAGLSYVALDGSIGCLVNGAGLAMATMDIIQHSGGEPANFLDVGGGATAKQVTEAFKIILSDDKVRAILVNIFGGIAKCDVIAEGVVTAAREVGLSVPLVVRLEGTNVEAGKKILSESGLAITPASDMLDAATRVVTAAGEAA